MKGKLLLLSLTVSVFYVSSCQKKSGSIELKSEVDTISYFIGHNIGTNLKNSPMKEVNVDAMAAGLEKAMNGEELFMDENAANTMIGEYMRKLEYAQGAEELKIGEDFLAKNKSKKGVITTESGLQYEIIREGTGSKPAAEDVVNVHYHGTTIDGTVFDSSVDRGEPAQFGVGQVIPGWTEALMLMPVGSKWKLVIPSELAYGANPRPGGPIKPNMVLIFDVELLSIEENAAQ